MATSLSGPTVNRPQGERVPINIDTDVRDRFRTLLYEPEMRGVGWSEFLNRACEMAETEIAQVRTARAVLGMSRR